MRDMAHVYRDLHAAHERLKTARCNTEFLAAQQRFEQVEAEWIELGAAIGLVAKS